MTTPKPLQNFITVGDPSEMEMNQNFKWLY